MSEKNSRAAAILFIASVISVYMFVNFQKAILVSIFDKMGSDFGVKAAGTMSFTATFMLVYSAMQLVTGQLVDRFGGGRVLVFGSLFMTVGAVMFPLSPWLWMVYLSRVLTGIGAATIYLCAVKEIDRLFPGSFTKVLGITMLVGYLGTGMAELLKWVVVPLGSWRIAVGCFDAALVAATTALVVLSFRQEKPPVKRGGRLFSFEPYKEAFRNRNLMRMLCASPFMYAPFLMLLNTIVKKMLRDVGHFSDFAAGIVFWTLVIMIALFQLVPGALEDLLHRRRKTLFMIQLSNAWCGVVLTGLGVFSFGGGSRSLGAVLMIFGLCMMAASGGSTPLTASIFREISDPKAIGVALSMSNFLVYLLTTIAGLAAGFLMDVVGGDAIRKAGDVTVYPTRSYLAVLTMLLLMETFAIWNGSRVPETNGKNIYGSK